MFAFTIVESEIKDFMAKLLREEVFDIFEVRGAELSTFTKFEISCVLDKDYLPESLQDTAGCFCKWQQLRPVMFGLIKGNKRPKSFKIVFSLPQQEAESLHKSAAGYFLNLTFDGATVLCTATASEKSFTMDKSIEAVWQEYLRDFFRCHKILVSHE